MQNQASALRANDQLEHALLAAWSNAADAGICAVDESLRVVMLNPSACAMLGVDGLAMLNQPFSKLVAAVKFAPGIAQWLATPGMAGERQASCERRGATIDILFKATTVKLAGDDASAVSFKVIAMTDVTLLMVQQREVNSESYRRQWQALNAGVVVSDALAPDMPIIYVNQMFEHMSGYASGEVLGRNCRFLQRPEDSRLNQTGLAAIRQAILNQSNGYAKLRNYRKDGSLFVNELFISPVKDGAGIVTHFVGIQHLQTPAG